MLQIHSETALSSESLNMKFITEDVMVIALCGIHSNISAIRYPCSKGYCAHRSKVQWHINIQSYFYGKSIFKINSMAAESNTVRDSKGTFFLWRKVNMTQVILWLYWIKKDQMNSSIMKSCCQWQSTGWIGRPCVKQRLAWGKKFVYSCFPE